jgi:hypothetical protein
MTSAEFVTVIGRRSVMPAFSPSSTAACGRRAAIGGLAAAAALASAIALAGPAASAAAAAKPGPVGAAIVLAQHQEFTGSSTDIATDSHGTSYIGWISASTVTTSDRVVHLCVLPLGSRSCTGGVQSISAIDPSTAADLHVLAPAHGSVTLLWYHDTVASGSESHGAEIAEATVSGSKLSAGKDVATGPSHGALLDAVPGPSNSIWTMTYAGSGTTLELREGLSHSPTLVKTPYTVGYAHLAFSHGTPILAITQAAQITQPPSYSSRPGSSWKPFRKLTGTWAVGIDIGLVDTRSGVRIVSGDGGNDIYQPVVAKWTKSGFSRARSTGDHNAATPSSHDDVTDGSGRLVDVSNEGGQIAVANLADTTHAAVVRLAGHGTLAGFAPQVGTTARGNGVALWAVEQGNGTLGDELLAQPIRLAGLHASKKAHGRHGSVTVTGPASCMPDSTLSVAVKGKAAHGWHSTKPSLTLGHKKVGHTLNGAKLTAGKSYVLKGSVIFVNGGSHSKVTAKLKFRACPKP